MLTLRSANRARPLLQRSDQLRLAMEPDTTVVLNGLVLAGAPLVLEESADAETRRLVLRHCTLVPAITRDPDGSPPLVGRASLIVLHPFAEVVLDHCVVGPVVAVEGAEVRANDSVIDASGADEVAYCGRAPAGGGGLLTVSSAADRETGDGLAAGGHLTLEACTVLGKVHAQRLDVSNSLLLAQLDAPPATPGPRRCGPSGGRSVHPLLVRPAGIPDAAPLPVRRRRSRAPAVPHLAALRRPGLHAAAALDAPRHPHRRERRERDGRRPRALPAPARDEPAVRLDEYLRYGLEAGFFYAT